MLISRLSSILISIYVWTIGLMGLFLAGIVITITSPFVSTRICARIFTKVWGYTLLFGVTLFDFWQINFEVKEPLDINQQYVIIANHNSIIDTLFMLILPYDIKFMCARSFAFPGFKWICEKTGIIFVANEDRSTTVNAVAKASFAMNDGSSFMLYPEGTRNRNKFPLLPFKTGAFRLAQMTNVKILPIILQGTNKIMPFGMRLYPGEVKVTIGTPFAVGPDREGIEDARRQAVNIMNHVILT